MVPILYKCGFLTIYTYGVCVAIAFLLSSWLVSLEARRRKLNEDAVYNLCIVILAGGIIFARLFYVVLNLRFFLGNPFEIVMLQHGGLVWFGGLMGAIFCALGFIKFKKMPVLKTLDLLVPYAALAQGIGRIGCFFNGCCYGKESAFGIYFPVHGRVLFPSQLLDSLTLLLIFVILRLNGEKRRDGEILAFYLMLASLQRFLLEFVRGDLRPFYFSLSIFQWISIGLFTCGLSFYLILRWKKNTA
jgi:phosphatidylglycerol:prolipoprotein diacylglycerol transferase